MILLVQIKKVQHRLTRMVPGMKDIPYKDRLKQLGLWTLEERQNSRLAGNVQDVNWKVYSVFRFTLRKEYVIDHKRSLCQARETSMQS